MDKYYDRPVLYDYFISLIVIIAIVICEYYEVFYIDNSEKYVKIATDIGRTGLIVSGFILTMVTILLSLKSNQIIMDKELKNSSPAFLIFLASPLFKKSINILKYGIISLVTLSISLYVISLTVSKSFFKYMLYFDLVGLIIIFLTFLRCLYVLSLILKTQVVPKKESN
ncbi:hypothetical protein [uncultured Aquimarina sp.]|uniref:hypothetical protein n=1 Tax=uncultured Aquimarina sp. TaxID=575652 RepID=UPI00262E388E|nr:hypothetical protein [uncultured Aquimarina sp.]